MSTFQKYYADPEFREKYKAYMYAKIVCDCGFLTARGNLSRHKKSKNHANGMDKIEKAETLCKHSKHVNKK